MTTIQPAITQIQSRQTRNITDSEWRTYQKCLTVLTALLPTEKQQTIAAYNRTWDDTGTNGTAEEYYDKIYQND